MLIFTYFKENIDIKLNITGSFILDIISFVIFKRFYLSTWFNWPKKCQKMQKNSQNRKKQQKYAYFCLFLAGKSRGTSIDIHLY